MLINNNYIELPDGGVDFYKQAPNYFEENAFINNLMLNPGKYRDFKRNINRINNIDNEINYLKSLEKKNEIDFVSNIKISEEEYENALKDAEIIFENLNEEQISDLISHQKLLSNEKHLIETMNYFLGNENFDWNIFKISFSLYEAKTKMKKIDYSKLRKKKINILLSQLCRSDKMNNFLNMNDFCDSGMEFVYEWVKCQLKIYFYLYQNKKIHRIRISKSLVDVYNNKNKYNIINEKNHMNEIYNNNNNDDKISNITGISGISYNNKILNSSICYQNNTQKQIGDNLMLKNSTDIDTIYNHNYYRINKSNSLNNKVNFSNKINMNTFQKTNSVNNNNNKNKSTYGNSTILITSLPNIKSLDKTNESTFLPYQQLNIHSHNLLNKIYKPIETKKVNIKLKGFNKEKEKLIKEIRTAEMLPLLKNKTYHQMRNFFDDRVPFNRKIDKRITSSLNGETDEQRLISLNDGGKIKALNYDLYLN